MSDALRHLSTALEDRYRIERHRRVLSFDVSPDGRRFYLGLRAEVPALTLVLNWWALLRP